VVRRVGNGLDLTKGAGGWWVRPSNWKSNTTIAFAGILGVTFAVWSVSADKEVRRGVFSLRLVKY
jgi:hypothetical protein